MLRLYNVAIPPTQLLKGTGSLNQLIPFNAERLKRDFLRVVDDSGVLKDHLDQEGGIHMKRFLSNLFSDSYMVSDIVRGQVTYSGRQGGDIQELEEHEWDHSRPFIDSSKVKKANHQQQPDSPSTPRA